MLNLLLICHANVCRSPMAESIFRDRLLDHKKTMIHSAGIAAMSGSPIHPIARKILASRAYPIREDASAVRLTAPMLNWADLALVMDGSQRRELVRRHPSAAGKVWLLGHWLARDVPDPVDGDDAVFNATLDLIEASVTTWQPALTTQLAV
jgi:protein-tyrosine phosphatase